MREGCTRLLSADGVSRLPPLEEKVGEGKPFAYFTSPKSLKDNVGLRLLASRRLRVKQDALSASYPSAICCASLEPQGKQTRSKVSPAWHGAGLAVHAARRLARI